MSGYPRSSLEGHFDELVGNGLRGCGAVLKSTRKELVLYLLLRVDAKKHPELVCNKEASILDPIVAIPDADSVAPPSNVQRRSYNLRRAEPLRDEAKHHHLPYTVDFDARVGAFVRYDPATSVWEAFPCGNQSLSEHHEVMRPMSDLGWWLDLFDLGPEVGDPVETLELFETFEVFLVMGGVLDRSRGIPINSPAVFGMIRWRARYPIELRFVDVYARRRLENETGRGGLSELRSDLLRHSLDWRVD